MADVRADILNRLGGLNENQGASVHTVLSQLLEEFNTGVGQGSNPSMAANVLTEQTKLLGNQALDIASRRVDISRS